MTLLELSPDVPEAHESPLVPTTAPPLPAVRGPISGTLFAAWADGRDPQPVELSWLDPLTDDDLHLALWACYQLHYGGFASLDDRLEWDPATLRFRQGLEAAFERALRDEHRSWELPPDPVEALVEMSRWSGPPLSSTVAAEGTLQHLREFAVHRSAYQLKEADPHTWAIPRLKGAGRSAMVEIQADEYGGGVPGEAHADLFAAAMVELGLSPEPARYIDLLPGETLATDNLVSLFGLHRRLRGALVGHLALFEMCSVVPMSRYLAAAERMGGLPSLERFYRVHVEVDEHHAEVALRGMVAPVVAAEPQLADDVILGAAALSRVEARFARRVLRAWEAGESSLRTDLALPA